MKTYIIGGINTSPQTLETGSVLSISEAYRKYICRGKCCLDTYRTNSNSIAIQHSGFYHVTVTATFTAPAAGVVTLQLAENGVLVPGALASETITTATTEVRSVAIDYYVLVNKGCVAGVPTALTKNISVVNTGVPSTVTNYVVNVEQI